MTTRKDMEGIWSPLVLSFLLGEKGWGAQKQPYHCSQPSWLCPGSVPLPGTVPSSGCCCSKGCIGTGSSADANWQHLLLPWPVQLLWPRLLKVLPQGSGCTSRISQGKALPPKTGYTRRV